MTPKLMDHLSQLLTEANDGGEQWNEVKVEDGFIWFIRISAEDMGADVSKLPDSRETEELLLGVTDSFDLPDYFKSVVRFWGH